MSGYLSENDQPGVHANSWYAETAGTIEDYAPLAGDVRADVCVIGAGYAGLSTALHLAEAGRKVIVVEANRVGWGASGRNGGQVGIGPRAEITDYERHVGRDDARKVWDISLAANQLVRQLVADHDIACDLTNGYVEAAAKPGHHAELEEFAEHVATTYGHPDIQALSREETTRLLGTEAYHGGYRDGLGAHVHPLRLALGLARAATQAGATICEHTHAVNVSPGEVQTQNGRIQAADIVIACNGYLDGLSQKAQRRMLPINNFILATAPLDADLAHRINPDNLAVCDTRFVLNYFRLSPDRRLLWGGGESTGRRFPANLQGLVRSRMLEIYPELASVEITHAWGGTLAITPTRMPLFQQTEPGIRAIGGWSGSGIHMATMGGKITADAICGDINEWDILARMPTPAFPGGDWFRMPLLRLAMFWYGLRDRL